MENVLLALKQEILNSQNVNGFKLTLQKMKHILRNKVSLLLCELL